jgi:Protein of unknown function (DUF4064)
MEQTNASAPVARPTFLTVLCILTWIGCAIGLIGSLIGGAATGVVSATSEMRTESLMNDTMLSPEVRESMAKANEAVEAAASSGTTIMIISIICILLCVVGSVMMWKLKKTGFYIYIIGELAAPIASLVLLGGSAFGGALAALGMIFPIIFVILYTLNLKHLK